METEEGERCAGEVKVSRIEWSGLMYEVYNDWRRPHNTPQPTEHLSSFTQCALVIHWDDLERAGHWSCRLQIETAQTGITGHFRM